MKRNLKSAPLAEMLALLCLLGLPACENVRQPHVFGPNEIPQNVKNAPRPFSETAPPSAQQTYPLLGNVPDRPKDFSSPDDIDRTKQKMIDDRAQAQTLKHNVQSSP